MKPDYYFVLPWHFKREFLERERKLIESGSKMIFPLPNLSIVDADNIDAELAALAQSGLSGKTRISFAP